MPESTHPKPLPVVTAENRPFWDGCRQGKFLLQYCEQCRQYQFYPRIYCMHCGNKNIQWVEASGRGTVYSYTIIHQNKSPEFVQDVPYNIVIIQLAEGPRMMSRLIDVETQNIRVDMPVTVVFEAVNDTMSIPYFRPL